MENFKNILKNFTKSLIKSKIVILILVIFLILGVLLPSFVYYITIDDGIWKDNEKASPSTYTNNVKFSTETGQDGIAIDKDGIINQILLDMGYNQEKIDNLTDAEIIEIFKLSKKLGKTINSLDDCTYAEILWCVSESYSKYLSKPEELEKLLNAEIITQYPKIGSANADLNGIIEFQRYKTDGTNLMLEYIDIDAFNEYIDDENLDIVNYFTVDENENVLIGVIDETLEELSSNDSEMVLSDYTTTLDDTNKISEGKYSKLEYSVYAKSINYKSVVSKYTMPFDYLWSLIVIGDDKDIALELADLVEDSEIVISIYDNIVETIDTSTYTYNKQNKVDVTASASAVTTYGGYASNSGSWSPAVEWEDNIDYLIKHKVTYKVNSVIADVTKANVWIVDYSKEYTYQASQQTSQEVNEKDLDAIDYIGNVGNPITSKEGWGLPEYGRFKDKLDGLVDAVKEKALAKGNVNNIITVTETGQEIPNIAYGEISSVSASYFTHEINRHQKDVSVVSEQKYVAGNVVNNSKVDKNSSVPNFVTILCDSSHRLAREKITVELSSWWFEILSLNDSTTNMVDLSKYLLYKVTDRSFGITEYDFNAYEYNNFNTLGAFISSNILFDYLASWENAAVWKYLKNESVYTNYVSKYITEDKSEYICYTDSNTKTRNFGFGVCHTGNNGKSYWHVSEYQEEGIDIATGQYDTLGVSKLSVNIVDSVKDKLLNSYQQSVKNTLQNAGILDEFEQYQIDSLTCIMYQYGNIGNFVDVYKKYGNSEQLITTAKSNSGKTYFNSNVESNGRSQANWKLFHEGKYVAGTGEELSSSNYIGSGKILDVATQVWKIICTSGKFPNYGGVGSIPSNGPNMDCSGFVSWVLYEMGYKEEFYYQHNTANFLNTDWNQRYGWQEISIDAGQNPYSILQPGDILVRNQGNIHHMNIVVELKDGRLYAYDCGNNSSWINNKSASPVDKTYFLNSNAKGKIIRITQ